MSKFLKVFSKTSLDGNKEVWQSCESWDGSITPITRSARWVRCHTSFLCADATAIDHGLFALGEQWIQKDSVFLCADLRGRQRWHTNSTTEVTMETRSNTINIWWQEKRVRWPWESVIPRNCSKHEEHIASPIAWGTGVESC